ncbi:MAG: hypothetical protein HC905_26520 [Bacteroidales bacterium]|nr:hypothetical protein [Bacteroidales bacterium]
MDLLIPYGLITITLSQRANAILYWADKVPIAADKINQRKGEVSFLRALAYFNIIRIYGGRPDVAEEDKYGAVIMSEFITSSDLEVVIKPRSSVAETYNLILSDLDNAIAYLPKAWGGSDKGRANKYSAFALKAKVLMTMAGTSGNADLWSKASAACDSVIGSNSFSLWNTVKNGAMGNSYADLFKKDAENGVESLF